MKALIIVDVQNDFCPGGALPVQGGHEVVPVINQLQKAYEVVVATKDWHPADHGSFAANHGKKPGEIIRLGELEQVLWPAHCVQGTQGAEFVSGLDTQRIDRVFLKGMDRMMDSYSGFFDNGHKRATGLDAYLRARGVIETHIVGLATDYCVKFTALDALHLGFRTWLIEDGSRGVNLQPGDSVRAIDEMRRAGARIAMSMDVLKQ